jgi:hypothetical protein
MIEPAKSVKWSKVCAPDHPTRADDVTHFPNLTNHRIGQSAVAATILGCRRGRASVRPGKNPGPSDGFPNSRGVEEFVHQVRRAGKPGPTAGQEARRYDRKWQTNGGQTHNQIPIGMNREPREIREPQSGTLRFSLPQILHPAGAGLRRCKSSGVRVFRVFRGFNIQTPIRACISFASPHSLASNLHRSTRRRLLREVQATNRSAATCSATLIPETIESLNETPSR